MVSMNVFQSDAFAMQSLTAAVEIIPYSPHRLGQMGLFEDKPITTRQVAIEERKGTLALIPTSPVGSPPPQGVRDERNLRSLLTRRLAVSDPIYAEEIQGIRAFGSESELESVQRVVADRMVRLRQRMELTHEFHRLGAAQGILLDAGGGTIYNFFTEFQIAGGQPAEIDFDLDNATPASGAVTKKCQQVILALEAAAESAWVPGTQIVGLCGAAFWDDLIAHPEVRETWLYTQNAAALRGLNVEPILSFGGITFERYRGNTAGTVGVGTNLCKFFPSGAVGVFEVGWSPLESMDAVNTLGRAVYALILPDPSGRNFFVTVELYSYPIHYCARPGVLQRAKRT